MDEGGGAEIGELILDGREEVDVEEGRVELGLAAGGVVDAALVVEADD